MAELERVGSEVSHLVGSELLAAFPGIKAGFEEAAVAGPSVRWDGRDPNAACDRCRGAGYVRRDVPPGDPDFGRLFDCVCEIGQARAKKRQDRIWSETLVPPRMAKYTLDSLAKRPDRAGLAERLRVWQRSGRWLVLFGSKGTCKTGSAVALLMEHVAAGGSGLYVVLPTFLQRIRKTYGDRDSVDEDEVLKTLIDAPFLVLDDVGTAALTPWGQEKVFTVVNERDGHQLVDSPRITVLTTNLTPKALEKHLDPEGRTWDRIRGWADQIELTGESQRGLDL
jgi:hypothetical protein